MNIIRSFSKNKSCKGLTLLELVVVLVVLAALAGLLIPMFPSIFQKTHAGQCAGNLAEINKFIETYKALNLSYPDGLDSLIDEDGNVPSYMPYSGAGLSVVDLSSGGIGSLSADDVVEKLNAAGITVTQEHLNPANLTGSATFENYSGSTIPIDTTAGQVVELDESTAATEALNLEVGNDYVVFGLGTLNEALGSVMQDAPLHFPDEGDPNESYNRFVLIFELPEEGPAIMAAAATLHESSIEGVGSVLKEYFENG